MHELGDGGGDISAIDPQQLGDLIKSISSRTGSDGPDAAQPQVSLWMSRASRIGLGTDRLSKIDKHLAWAQGELPMLRRRLSLALDLDKQNTEFGGGGMVSAGAGPLGKYKTQAAARRAAQEDAKAFKDGKLDIREYMQKLAANENDPDYCKAAMEELGDTGLYRLREGPAAYDPDNPDAGLSVLATALATAMRNGVTFEDDHGDEDIAALAPLLEYASFPKDVLVNLGRQCLAPGNYQYGKQVWKALAANSAAATQFLHDNLEYIPEWIKHDSDHHGGLPDDQAADFAQVIKAGTIGGPGADQNMAADNTTRLIKSYAEHPGDHTHSEIQAVFAQDIANYFPDLQATLTDPAAPDLGKGRVTVTSKEWQAFTGEAMQNAKAGANLLAYAVQQADQLARANPHNPVAIHGAGVLEGFFSQEAHNVYQQMVHDHASGRDSWKATFTSEADTAADTLLDAALDPQHAAKTVAVAGVKEVIHLAIGNFWSGGNAPPPPAPKEIEWNHDWKQQAANAYAEKGGHFTPVTTSDGITWTGDPDEYAREHSCPKFLDDSGNLQLSGTAQQQAAEKVAYDAWLKDPAVGQVLAGNASFNVRDLGRQDGEDLAGR